MAFHQNLYGENKWDFFTSGNTLLRSIATKEYIAAHFHGLVSQTQNYWKIWSILKNPQGFLLIKAKRVRDFNLNMLSLNAEMQYMHAAMQKYILH